MNDKQKKALEWLRRHCECEMEFEDNEETKETLKECVSLLDQIEVNNSEPRCKTCNPELPMKRDYAEEDVPWRRSGHPGSALSPEGRPWRKSFANTGALKGRLYNDVHMLSSEVGIEERAFACFWDYWQNGQPTNGIMDYILKEEPLGSLIRDERDRWMCMLVAQTVMQWLGTNCGRAFLEGVKGVVTADRARIKMEKEFLKQLRDCPSCGNGRD